MRSLSLKLVLAFLLVSLTGAALVGAFAIWTTTAQFNRFLTDQNVENLSNQLTEYYQANGSWNGLIEAYPFLRQGVGGGYRGGRQPGAQAGPPAGSPPIGLPSSPLLLVDNQGFVLIAGQGYSPGDRIRQAQWREGLPIEVDGQEVGRLLVARDSFQRRLAGAEAVFLRQVNRALIFGTAGATVVAVLLGVFLARTLTRPLRELTAATRAVAQGDLEQQVPVRSKDELGELAASFNQMNADLARSRDLRRQMTADIAHDLRTPLSVILGHTEALSENVLPPKAETFAIIHDEAQRLNRLVDDLRTLSLAEAGELPLTRRLVSPEALLTRTVTAHSARAEQLGITLQMETQPGLPRVDVDPDRMAQVLDNLVSNALRFSPTGVVIRLGASTGTVGVRLTLQDSGPGVPPEELPLIFERFYRGDKSRQRQEGGSGLGLAIAKSIVEAHDGRISAVSNPGEGLTFIVDLPVAGN